MPDFKKKKNKLIDSLQAFCLKYNFNFIDLPKITQDVWYFFNYQKYYTFLYLKVYKVLS